MSLAAKSAPPPPVSAVVRSAGEEEEICSSRAARLAEVDSERRESSAWTRFWIRSSKSLVRVLSVYFGGEKQQVFWLVGASN